jgi:hypothetical protein
MRSLGSPNQNGAVYGSDLDAGGLLDGEEYDRSAISGQTWRAGPPDNSVQIGDVLQLVSMSGTSCFAPP